MDGEVISGKGDMNNSSSKLNSGNSLKAQLENKKFHEKVDFILHRPVVEYCIIFLIIVDALLVTASLMLEIKLLEANYQYVAGEGTSATLSSAEISHHIHKLVETSEILHYTSLAILALFMIETFLKLYGQREKFFKRKVQIVDSFVIAISFALDIAVIVVKDVDSTVINGLGLIVILRLWRLVRIVNGAVVATKVELEEKIHEHKNIADAALEEVNSFKRQLEERDREVEFLKGRLAKYEPVDMLPAGSTRLLPYLPESNKFPKHVLGEMTDDEDVQQSAFHDIDGVGWRRGGRLSANNQSAFQSYEPGIPYQPTSQFPADQIKSKPIAGARYLQSPDGYNMASAHSHMADIDSAQLSLATPFHHNDVVDTADESDAVSIKPAKSRSGNTFTVKKGGVPMTSL